MWITGYGCETAAGHGADPLWKHAVEGRSCLVDGLGRIPQTATETIKDLGEYGLLASRPPLLNAVSAARQAMRMAGWDEWRPGDGLIVGTTTGQVSVWEPDLMAYSRGEISEDELDRTFRFEPLGLTVAALGGALDFAGPSYLVTTACAASTHALALALLWIRSGKVKRCLVGGMETLSRLTIDGFRSFQLLSSEIAKPFDEKRTGINLAEGAAFFCLEREPSRAALAAIWGGGFSNDAYHPTAPHPEGRGCFAAMKQALESAALTPADIAWVHAHGTGSPHNDLAESQAINSIFRARVPVSSTKAIHGHALAASGAIETLLCVKAIEEDRILPTFNLRSPDPKIPVRHARDGEKLNSGFILKNTLGFGGSNASIVIGRGRR